MAAPFAVRRQSLPSREGVSTVFNREALIDLLREKSLKFGDFTLASGKKASYYLDGKQVTLDAAGAHLIGEGILELLQDNMPVAVGGMSIGADPLVASVLTIAGGRQLPLKGFLVRKESKGHGTNRYIEGPVAPGDSATIVEDVVTTGGSSLLAIERAEEFGLRVERVITVVDRMEGGREAFTERGYRFDSLFTVEDLGVTPSNA